MKKKESQLNFQAYGVKVGILAETDFLSEIENRLGKMLPTGYKKIDRTEAVYILQVKQKKDGSWQLFKDRKNVANSASKNEFLNFVESEIRLTVAEFAVSKVFLHAGVVAWKGQAIVIPGRSFSGKTSLVAALIKKGALYYSDEYAVLDENGNVHPFPRMLSIRGIIDDFKQVDQTAESLGGKVGSEPVPVGLVLLAEYESSVDLISNELISFDSQLLSAGQGVLEIISQTIPIRNNPKFVLKVLNKMINTAKVVKTKRGEAEQFAELLLNYFESLREITT